MADHLEDPERGGARLGLAAALAHRDGGACVAVTFEPVVQWLETAEMQPGSGRAKSPTMPANEGLCPIEHPAAS